MTIEELLSLKEFGRNIGYIVNDRMVLTQATMP